MANPKRRMIVILTPVLLLATFLWYRQPAIGRPVGNAPTQTLYHGGLFNGTWDYLRDKDNLLLNQGECTQAFPALFDEIERAKRDRQSRPITFNELDSITPKNGYVRAMIYDQQVISYLTPRLVLVEFPLKPDVSP
jgi:hypothetical protein